MVNRIGGVVLCGGRSSRMGNSKAWLPVGDEFMLPRVVRLIGQVAAHIVVVAAVDQETPPLPSDVDVIRDPSPGLGPLQGVVAGLHALRGRVDAAYVSSCDVPFLQPAFVARLFELLGDYALCVPEVAGRRHPLAAVYRLEVGSIAERLLAENRLRLSLLCEEAPTRLVSPEELRVADPMLQTLRNLNTPQEYEDALRELFPTEKPWR
jgi:molybdopterin-guanine dinucleotide biosynthesis protein A